jgi:pseudouridine-5'-phosphate glycosidase
VEKFTLTVAELACLQNNKVEKAKKNNDKIHAFETLVLSQGQPVRQNRDILPLPDRQLGSRPAMTVCVCPIVERLWTLKLLKVT